MVRSTGAIWSSRRLNPPWAARRIDSKLPAPIQSGGWGRCVGRGSMMMLSKCQRLPWCEKRSLVAHAEVEPALRQEIECGDLLSEQGRIVPWQYHDGASKAYAPRAPCKVAQEIE